MCKFQRGIAAEYEILGVKFQRGVAAEFVLCCGQASLPFLYLLQGN